MERQVLVTGAGSGIGLETVLRLSSLGFGAVGLVRNDDEACRLRDESGQRRLDVAIVIADLADEHARAAAIDGIECWGLVNNAGYLNAGRVLDVGLPDARRQLEAMVLAPVQLAKLVVPAMIERGAGRIVNVTSAALHQAAPFSGWYQACKAALRELSDSLRLELAGYGIEVIDIEPGGVNTRIWSRGMQELRARQARSDRPGGYERAIGLVERIGPRLADPATVAEAVADVLTALRPPLHRRVGKDAPLLRAASELVPDRLWDKLLASRAVPASGRDR